MNENNNVCEVCGSGNGKCGRCGNMCGYGRNNILRWILGIIIITWVFCIGMKFGEVNAYMEQAGYGRGGYMKYYSSPMMGSAALQNGSFTVSTQAVPAMMTSGAVKVINSN